MVSKPEQVAFVSLAVLKRIDLSVVFLFSRFALICNAENTDVIYSIFFQVLIPYVIIGP